MNQKADQEAHQADPEDSNEKEVDQKADLDQKTEGIITKAEVAVTVAAGVEHLPEKAVQQKIEEAAVGAIVTRKKQQPEITMIADATTNPLLELEGAEVGTTTLEDQGDPDQEAIRDRANETEQLKKDYQKETTITSTKTNEATTRKIMPRQNASVFLV